MKRFVIIIALTITVSACGEQLKSGPYWKEVGSIGDGFIPLVVIDADHAHDGKTYQDAANSLSNGSDASQIGFFLPSDAVPASETRQDFFSNGGWASYSPAAIYSKSEFTKWDCDKAGTGDAPLSALCGDGAQEQYDAVLHLAGRDGWVEGCHAPPIGGKAIVERFASTFDERKKQQLIQAYDEFYNDSVSGPDDPSDCVNLREKMDKNAAEAKRILIKATLERSTGHSNKKV